VRPEAAIHCGQIDGLRDVDSERGPTVTSRRPAAPRARLASGILALVIGMPLLLAGCTPAPAPSATPSHPAAADVNGLPTGVQQATDVPTEVPNTPALRRNVTVSTCEKADDGWKAAGTAKNDTDDPVELTVTVFFTTDKGTVLGTGDTKVAVKPQSSADWTVTSKLTPTAKTVCVLRGVG